MKLGHPHAAYFLCYLIKFLNLCENYVPSRLNDLFEGVLHHSLTSVLR